MLCIDSTSSIMQSNYDESSMHRQAELVSARQSIVPTRGTILRWVDLWSTQHKPRDSRSHPWVFIHCKLKSKYLGRQPY